MKIVVDLTSLSYHITGIERYAVCVTEQMLKQDDDNQYVLIFRNEVYEQLSKYIDGNRVKSVVLVGNKKIIFLQYTLLKCLKKNKADKYMFFAYTSPFLFKRKGIYNTIHDMGAWDSADSMKLLQKIYWRISYRRAVRVAEGIITVSEFSKKRIENILKYSKEKVHVVFSAVYEGVTKEYGILYDDIRKKYNLPSKYIMTLSTLEPRKNMKILLEAFSEVKDKVDYDLVLVGRRGWKMDDVLDKYNCDKRIYITGFVEDKHLSGIYKNALCFVFPSLYEGFGLPPVEALSLGTPVISSDAASLPEVLMEQATYFKNNSKEELKNILLNLEKNIKSMADGLNEKQLREYNFETSAKKILDIIKQH